MGDCGKTIFTERSAEGPFWKSNGLRPQRSLVALQRLGKQIAADLLATTRFSGRDATRCAVRHGVSVLGGDGRYILEQEG